jgi:glutamine kinase
MNNSNLLFSSKANTLKFLQSKIKKSKIEKLYSFTVKEWNENNEIVLNHVKKYFSNKIVVRSSAMGEDSFDKSEAGKFETVLNLDVSKIKNIKKAIDQVIKSYDHKGNQNQIHQVLIQNQTLNSKTSGVIFTKTLENGSPYYVINFEDSSSTDSVTKGIAGNTIKIYNKVLEKDIPEKWKKLIIAVKEIEKITKNSKLDIEFGITKNSVVIFQVRPITTIKNHVTLDIKQHVNKEIEKNQKKINQFQNKLSSNKTVIFSNMSDWNPAEIIGSNPHKLDYSLYDFLIMQNSWSEGRQMLGYNNTNTCLMQEFSGRPYVNVNVSFNSLLPSKIDIKLQKKMINYFLKKIQEKPHLHDKVEFEILFTCYDFSLKKRIKDLKKYGFTKKELEIIEKELVEFTNNLIKLTPNILTKTTTSLMILEKKRVESKHVLKDYKNKLSKAESLLENCKKYGAIQFAAIARLAFVSKILLNSVPEISNISKHEIDIFMNSISTSVTEFQNDLFNLKTKKLKKNQFLNKYGHLRPGTYDITKDRYDKMPEFLNSLKFLDVKKPQKIHEFKKNIEKIIKKHGLIFDEIDFFDFVKNTIQMREKVKFEFTKSLSDVIELIADAGDELGFNRNQLANLSLNDILKYKIMNKKKLVSYWKEKSIANNTRTKNNRYVQLPPILFSSHDFSIIRHYIAKPNFITNVELTANTVLLDSLENLEKIKSKIVIIQNADPGYDWIFTKKPAGLITKYGGVASHMAIRCAELGLPAAIGCGDILFEKLKISKKIHLSCKNEDILILDYEQKNDFSEEKNLLKSLGYIK